MTSEQFIAKQEKAWKEIGSKALAVASLETHRAMANRIFNEGGAKVGSIGNYNTTDPLYVNPKNSPKKFPTGGKYGDKVHKNKTPYKTKYFSSYSAFRGAIGRPTGKVNLNLSGRLQSDFVNGIRRQDSNTFVSVLKRQENINKKRGAERHFGKPIFSLTPKERQLFITTINKEVQIALHAQ